MTTSITKRAKRPHLSKVGAALLWLVLWQCAYWAVGQDLLLSSPLAVLGRLGKLAITLPFWATILRSFLKITAGFLLGVVAGAAIALLTARFPLCYDFFSLPMGIVKSTPVASFIILALVWVSGSSLSVFISFLMVLPLVWSNVHQGLLSADESLLEMARVYHFSKNTVFRVIVLPAVLPYFLSACQVGLGFAWKAGIAGEVLAMPRGAIGTQLYNAKVALETADLFAWTVVIVLLSILIEKLLTRLVAALVRRWGRPEAAKEARP